QRLQAELGAGLVDLLSCRQSSCRVCASRCRKNALVLTAWDSILTQAPQRRRETWRQRRPLRDPRSSCLRAAYGYTITPETSRVEPLIDRSIDRSLDNGGHQDRRRVD